MDSDNYDEDDYSSMQIMAPCDPMGGVANLDDELYPELSYLLVGDLAFMTNGGPNSSTGTLGACVNYITMLNTY
jgi:hypothetical protein